MSKLDEVIQQAVDRLRAFCRKASEGFDAEDMDADASSALREVYAEPPEGTSDAWLVADITLITAALAAKPGPEWTRKIPSEGWHWFIGDMKRGAQVFKFLCPTAVYVEGSRMFKGPRGLSFFTFHCDGVWMPINDPPETPRKVWESQDGQ